MFTEALRDRRYRLLAGLFVSIAAVAAATGAIYGLTRVAPVVSLSVVHLPAVVLVSATGGWHWGS